MSERLAALLDEGDAALWQRNLDLEQRGARERALAVLDEFVATLSAYRPERRAAFAEEFCALASAADATLPVRHPLLVGVICPYLAVAHARRDISALRWMVRLRERNVPLYECGPMFDPDRFGTTDLLREILAQDPADNASRRRLISELSRHFDYSIHEVPAGILYNANGATITECLELLEELEELRSLVEAEGLREEYGARIREWALHFRGYADYLSNREEYASYAAYMNAAGRKTHLSDP